MAKRAKQTQTLGFDPELAKLPSEIRWREWMTRAGVSDIIGHEASHDIIAALRDQNMITAGPRSPTPGAPFSYATTKRFLEHLGLDRLRDLPEIEALEDAGLLRSGGEPVGGVEGIAEADAE